MFLFPKRFNTISKCNTFKNIKYVDYEKKEIITNFNYSMIYKIFFRKHKKPKEDSLIKFKEPISNFREGGISTQYNFWKWNYSLE